MSSAPARHVETREDAASSAPCSHRSGAARLALDSVVVRTACAAVIAALSLAFVEGPFGTVAGILPAASILLPPALVATLVSVLGMRVLEGIRRKRSVTSVEVARAFVVLAVATTLLGAGVYFANVLLISPPFGVLTVIGYAITIVITVLGALVVRRMLFCVSASRVLIHFGLRPVAACLGLAFVVACVVVDGTQFREVYFAWHLAAESIALITLSVAILALDRYSARARFAMWLIASGLGVVAIAAAILGRDGLVDGMVRHPSLERRLLMVVSSLRGQQNVRALPPVECSDVGGLAELRAPSSVLEPLPTPRLIVLLTLDAFRCGFGRDGRPELRDVCPRLTELAAESDARTDGHASAPATYTSVGAMQLAGDAPLGERLRRLGMRTSVIVNHPRILEPPGVRASFDEIDESLVPRSRGGMGITSEATTDLALQRVHALEKSSGDRLFLWVHYFDTHAPYVERPASPWRLSSLDAYIAEVRRTDAAVGRLVDALRSPSAPETVLILTADHGEEFLEHGGTTHGFSLYEETTRIPILAWSNRRGKTGQTDLPVGSPDVGPFVLATATGQRFVSARDTVMVSTWTDLPQEGLVLDRWKLIEHTRLGYLELYDLSVDPGEVHDLSHERSDKLRELRCRLESVRSHGRLPIVATD